ncbi:hypothetical protein QJS04_geneDACA022809 [Acorus gramineus]|uniref:Uncharacterized protein n=1 Tax=Acorus gramineus TaxID=55184 RepID=A0AAV9B111_ACOGR|nr:hypothetical protein QJS04_geneDACA022809 [Acorus gramineus]
MFKGVLRQIISMHFEKDGLKGSLHSIFSTLHRFLEFLHVKVIKPTNPRNWKIIFSDEDDPFTSTRTRMTRASFRDHPNPKSSTKILSPTKTLPKSFTKT